MMQTTPFIVRLSHTLLSIGLIILFMYIAKSVLVPLIFASLFCIVLMNALRLYGASPGAPECGCYHLFGAGYYGSVYYLLFYLFANCQLP